MSTATLQVPHDVIDPIVRAEVTKAIIEAMGNRAELLTQAIASVLNAAVDSEGKFSNYSSDRNRTWIDWAVGHAIRAAAKEAITEVLTLHKEKIKQSMVRMLQQKNSPLLKQLAEGMIDAAANPDVLKYRISIAYDEKSR